MINLVPLFYIDQTINISFLSTNKIKIFYFDWSNKYVIGQKLVFIGPDKFVILSQIKLQQFTIFQHADKIVNWWIPHIHLLLMLYLEVYFTSVAL